MTIGVRQRTSSLLPIVFRLPQHRAQTSFRSPKKDDLFSKQSLMHLVAHPVTHENLQLWLQVAIGITIGFLYSLPLPISIPNGIDDCFIFETAVYRRRLSPPRLTPPPFKLPPLNPPPSICGVDIRGVDILGTDI
jgi:hypothetical protein